MDCLKPLELQPAEELLALPSGRLHAEQRTQLDALQHDAPALPLPHVSRADGRGANGHLTDVQVLADDHGALEGVGLVRLVLLWRSGAPFFWED